MDVVFLPTPTCLQGPDDENYEQVIKPPSENKDYKDSSVSINIYS